MGVLGKRLFMDQVLSSWKQVANYLGRGVRTVQRWEHTLQLPVQRPVTRHRRYVFAVPGQLNAWMGIHRQSGARHAAVLTVQRDIPLNATHATGANGGNGNYMKTVQHTTIGFGWTCSSCRQLITRIEDGWVEWLAGKGRHRTTTLKGLHLVHQYANTTGQNGAQRSCRYDEHYQFKRRRNLVEGLPLARFVGADGLMFLLSLLADGELPLDELVELTKRVQIPGYERARKLLRNSTVVIRPAIKEGFYLQSEIQQLLSQAPREP